MSIQINTRMKPNHLFLCLFLMLSATLSQAQKIGLLMDSYVIDRWYVDEKLFRDRIKELGGNCIVEMPFGDADEQINLGKKLIEEEVKVLVIVPTDAKKAAIIVAAAKEAGIPVISYDRLIMSKDVTFYVSYDNSQVGALQADYVHKRSPAGNYLLINGPVSDNNAILFREGQLKTLKPAVDAGKVKITGDIILDGWSEIEAMMKVDEYLNSGNVKPDVIIAANDALANGAIQALPTDFAGKILITGQDAELAGIKNIISGNQVMTIYKPIKPLAYLAAESAMMLARGEKIPNTMKFKNGDIIVDAILLKPVVVDKTNYQTVLKDGHVTLSQELNK